MTQYHGGKHRQGKKIAQVLNAELDNHIGYCEPFHGMLGVYRHIVYKPDLTYLAGDTNKSVMLMWQEAQNGWVPSSRIVSKEEFETLKYNGESTAEKGFIGCTHAYRGTYFRNYCLTEGSKNALPNTAKRVSAIALNSVVSKVKFEYGSYTQFSDLRNFLIYCDPPYENSAGYRSDQSRGVNHYDSFNNSEFWTWAKKMAEHNTVYVTESSLPKDVNYEVVLSNDYHDARINKKQENLFKILN